MASLELGFMTMPSSILIDIGDFLNRDPIEEAGGLNLYGLVNNDPANSFDVLGMDDCKRAPGYPLAVQTAAV
jgi:hypothetical protein